MYKTIRAAHRLLASISLPFLLMYGVSAVQMSHGTWFRMTPTIRESRASLTPALSDARAVAREVTSRAPGIRGELSTIKARRGGITLRLVLPGTVHEVEYDATSGEARIRTSIAGTMGMLNRLHHAAGLWHEPLSMKLWGAAAAVVSVALLLLGATGIYMWFARRTERLAGAVLLGVNLIVVLVLLGIMRRAGP
jgi:hypothetical protein